VYAKAINYIRGEMRNAYKTLVCKPKGMKPLGIPRRIWEYNIK
jgi:hypothetical protein